MNRQIDKVTFIVDKDPFWTAKLTQILADLGYTNIVTFSNGADCVKNFDLNPNLIILDYQLKDMDGLELLQKIKIYNAEIVVIFCTEHKKLSVAVNAIKSGSLDYLVKSGSTNKELALLINNMEEMRMVAEKMY